jgi:hypothetical protein
MILYTGHLPSLDVGLATVSKENITLTGKLLAVKYLI